MCHGNGIKFEHCSSGFTDAVRRNQNARKSTGLCGRLLGHSPHGSTTQQQHSTHGLRRRRHKTSTTPTPQQQPRFFVTLKVKKQLLRKIRLVSPSLRGAVASHYAPLSTSLNQLSAA
ncbi:hypothetical protein AMECASPLE_015616 [Ameca splendens]|uniref:Uncharacterized protein n=3 Tax=Goodeidae TaxID=28758 RepID=A0ABU7ACV9_9TELE|nr:hypothetical protein [Ataeniobius toweri]MED6269590.1 hypothetical protein [Characodon lateralis]